LNLLAKVQGVLYLIASWGCLLTEPFTVELRKIAGTFAFLAKTTETEREVLAGTAIGQVRSLSSLVGELICSTATATKVRED
jgi:hypothetical protein